jgi:uncharacterized protein YqjF (DUF2071 family)
MSSLVGTSGPLRQATGLARTEHRPWPLPTRPWFMGQTWSTLLFAHWPVQREQLERVMPPGLLLDWFEGTTWVGVTPFGVSGLRLRGTTPAPLLSYFPELNVRTYVSVGGKPGIYFLSLDAARRLAVMAARRIYRLPYFHARMARNPAGDEVAFASERISADGPPASFRGRYRATGRASPARPGSLEHFLTERYCLYTLDERQRIFRGEIHHPPWPLRPAEAEIELNTMAAPFEIELPGTPVLHFSERQDVALWRLYPVDA